MTCTLRRASEEAVRRLMAEPAEVSVFLHGPEPVVRRVRFPGVLGFILRLLPIRVEEVDPSSPAWAPPEEVLDLESWHGLHFLLTGTAWDGGLPAGFLLKGGTDIDDGADENTPRVLAAAQVRVIDALLQSLSRPELTRRYDARRMTELEIYPERMWQRDTDEEHPGLDHLLDAFDELQAFIGDARAAGQALVVNVS